jgi:hypothetical protein
MARLFITPREIDFISDLTKEITKDVIGQRIYYYRVREDLTQIHDIYEEAIDKIFDRPVEIEAMIEWEPAEFRTNRFGGEEYSTISAYIHARDMLDREIKLRDGDYFSYGTVFFEVTSVLVDKQIFGQVEHKTGYKMTGKQARQGQIDVVPNGPLDEKYTDDNAVQKEFVQQRGFEENKLGKTGDKRQLQEDGKLEAPISKPAEVSERGDASGINSSFYADNC